MSDSIQIINSGSNLPEILILIIVVISTILYILIKIFTKRFKPVIVRPIQKEPSELIEYLYMDEQKINVYIDQINRNNNILLVSWDENGVVFSQGVNYNEKTQPFVSEMRLAEKVEFFLEYLKRNDLLQKTFCTPKETYKESIFRYVEGEAIQILLPKKNKSNLEIPEFKIWYISKKNIDFEYSISGHYDNTIFNVDLFLINGQSSQLENHAEFLSYFTSMSLFLEFYEPELAELNLELSKLQKNSDSNDNKIFVKKLQEAGAIFINKQTISVIYKDRKCTIGEQDNQKTITIFGYPLIIYSGLKGENIF